MTQFGVQVSTAMCEMREVRQAWAAIEELGFDWISGQDHFYTMRAPRTGAFEALTTHAALAALTKRPRVGCLVYAAGYRHPAVMANAMVTVDHLSGGRLEVGIGAGWLQAEFEDYGLPWEPTPVRLRRMIEVVEIMRSMWTNDTTDFDGEFYSLRGARCDPKPMQRQPRIWVGARGPKALRAAAEIGDGWNANFLSPEDFAMARDVLRSHEKNPGRLQLAASAPLIVAPDHKIDEIMRHRYGATAAVQAPAALAGSIGRITHRVGEFVEAGADWIILAIRPPFQLDDLEAFANEVMPNFM